MYGTMFTRDGCIKRLMGVSNVKYDELLVHARKSTELRASLRLVCIVFCCRRLGESGGDYAAGAFVLFLVRRSHLQMCQRLAKSILTFFVSCRSWLTNRRANTMRSSVRRRRLAARLSRGVELARSVLTRTPLARPSVMLLPHVYTSPCI